MQKIIKLVHIKLCILYQGVDPPTLLRQSFRRHSARWKSLGWQNQKSSQLSCCYYASSLYCTQLKRTYLYVED